jgi:oxygen-independent coproporphyrinogen-3 oxidase
VGKYLTRDVAERLEPFANHGLVHREGGDLVLATHALPYARSIAALFDPYRHPTSRKFSSAV